MSETDKHTNQRAELTGVIRALQLVRARGLPYKQIQIFTDSTYAVQGVAEWIPKWRTNGYRTAQNKPVRNADLFKILDQEKAIAQDSGISIMLSHVPRAENSVADSLAKVGAEGILGGPEFLLKGLDREKFPSIIGRPLFEKARPLVQWTPDGSYWAKSIDLRDEHGNIRI